MKKILTLTFIGVWLFPGFAFGFPTGTGSGGLFLPKNSNGVPIEVTLDVVHPKEEKVFEVLEALRAPEIQKDYFRRDLERAEIYYSNETVRLSDLPEEGGLYGPEGQQIFPVGLKVDNDTLVAAYTFANYPVVIYFKPVLDQMPEEDQIDLVFHEAIHRLSPYFHQRSRSERFTMAYTAFLKRDWKDKEDDGVVQERYRKLLARLGLIGYEVLPDTLNGEWGWDQERGESSYTYKGAVSASSHFSPKKSSIVTGVNPWSVSLRGRLSSKALPFGELYDQPEVDLVIYPKEEAVIRLVVNSFQEVIDQVNDQEVKDEMQKYLDTHEGVLTVQRDPWRAHQDVGYLDRFEKRVDFLEEAKRRFNSYYKLISGVYYQKASKLLVDLQLKWSESSEKSKIPTGLYYNYQTDKDELGVSRKKITKTIAIIEFE